MLTRSLAGINSLEWDITAEQITQKTDEAIDFLNESIDKIVKSERKSFDNVIKALDDLSGVLTQKTSMLTFQAYVSTDENVRKSSSEASSKLSKAIIEISFREDLYQAILEAKSNSPNLSERDQTLSTDTLKDFERNGLHLDKEAQGKLKALKEEISELAIQFRQALNEANEKFTFTLEELDGVPENTLKNFKRTKDGKYLVGLSYPEVFPIFDFCDVSSTREKLTKEFYNVATKENTPRLERLIELRAKVAQLLGFKSHGEYSLDVKLAKNPERVFDFLDDLEAKLKPKAKEVLKSLSKLKMETEPNSFPEIMSHDYQYYTRLYKEKNFEIDFNDVKKYFPLERTLNAMFRYYQEVFHLIFSQVDNIPTWHPEVTAWDVSDKESKNYIGRFFLDLYPRDGKYSHAAAFTIVKGVKISEKEYLAPASAMVCNFNKPTPDEPSLLSHSEVETLFHEFGHIIHQVITTEDYARYSATSVKRDFVEAPSQMLENWTWEPEVINRISGHYETKEPLSAELLMKMKKAKDEFASLDYLRQIFYAKFDMSAYTNSSYDTKTNWETMMKETTLIPAPPDTNRAASFGHLAGGYDAGYYGYLWSEVYAHDLYSRFKKEGPSSPSVGKDYRNWILEKGGIIDEDILVENFLGRKVNNEAFLESIGAK